MQPTLLSVAEMLLGMQIYNFEPYLTSFELEHNMSVQRGQLQSNLTMSIASSPATHPSHAICLTY